MEDLTRLVAAFVAQTYNVARQAKPDVTKFEIEGLSFRLLISALDFYTQNEQLQESSPTEGSKGTPVKPEQIPGTGGTGWESKNTQGIRKEQRSTTKSGRRKRRSKK